MLIPITVTHLHEADTRFTQASGQQTLPPEVFGLRLVDAIQLHGSSGFATDVHNARCFRLHPEGQFHRLNSCLKVLVGPNVVQIGAIERLSQVQLLSHVVR